MKFKSLLQKLLVENLENKKLIALYDKFIAPAETGKDEKLKKALNLKIKDETTNKVKNLTPFEVFKTLISIDPTTSPSNVDWNNIRKKEDLDKIKIGQYVNWLMRTFILAKELNNPYEPGTEEHENRFKIYQKEIFEDADMIKGLLEKFFRYQKRIPENKRNIMNIDGVQELMDLPVRATTGGDSVRLIEYEGKIPSKAFAKDDETSNNSPAVRFSYPGSQILKVGSNYTLVKIPAGGELGQKAASFFGGYHLGSSSPSSNETNWCTSPENSHNFKSYIQQAPLYLLLANDDKGEVGIKSGLPKERYQIHFGNYRQFKDRLNGNFDLVKELASGKFSEFKDFFKDEFKKGVGNSSFETSAGSLSEGEYIIKLSNPNPTATSDYIKIYGDKDIQKENPEKALTEQLEKLPETCSAIKIVNDTKEELAVAIPDEILRFNNLKTLNITRLAKSLPRDFSGFSKLRFLSLIDNKNLTTLPEGLENLKSLVFINLMKTDNLNFSEKFKENFEQDPDEQYFWTPK